jgi:hypothetical protein
LLTTVLVSSSKQKTLFQQLGCPFDQNGVALAGEVPAPEMPEKRFHLRIFMALLKWTWQLTLEAGKDYPTQVFR